MAIFNSLGSNYSCRFSWLALAQLFWPNRLSLKKLKNRLESDLGGKVSLVWKGRDAIELILTSYNVGPDDRVMTQAFCCYSIEEAVKRVGAEIVYADLPKSKLSLDYLTFKKQAQKHSDLRVVILQHVLGYVDEVGKIADYCRQHDILLIEDLAQSLGALYSPHEKVGKLADACVFSFGRDKVVDALSGGAALFRTTPSKQLESPFALDSKQPELSKQKHRIIVKDMLYPVLTGIIRGSYSLGLGKALHHFAQKFGWFYSPVKSFHHHYQSLPAYYAPLILSALDDLATNIDHRRKIAHYYFNQLQNMPSVVVPVQRIDISRGTNLRFPLLVSDPHSLLKFLRARGIYLSDRWYKQPVASGRQKVKSSYQRGSCPHAEEMAAKIINLPTHRHIDIQQAEKIVKLLKKWLNKQA